MPGWVEASPYSNTAFDGVPQTLRPALPDGSETVGTRIEIDGEPTAVEGVPGARGVVGVGKEPAQPFAAEMKLGQEPGRGIGEQPGVGRGQAVLGVDLVQRLVPGLAVAVGAVVPRPQGHERARQVQERAFHHVLAGFGQPDEPTAEASP